MSYNDYNNYQRPTDPEDVPYILGFMAALLVLVIIIYCCHKWRQQQQEEQGNAPQPDANQVEPEQQHPPHANQIASGLSIQHYPSPVQQYPQQFQQYPPPGPQPLQQYQPYVLYYLPPQEYTPSGTAVSSNPAPAPPSAPASPPVKP